MKYVILSLFLGLPVLAAPVPKTKSIPGRPSIVGIWNMNWNNASGPAHFAKDGSYSCDWLGTHYYGSWTLKDNTLSVRERKAYDPDASWIDWTIHLEEGKLFGVKQVRFELTQITPKVQRPDF